MSAPIPLRQDWCVPAAWFGEENKDGPQARRLLALAAIYDGGPVECAEPNAQPTKGWLLNPPKHVAAARF